MDVNCDLSDANIIVILLSNWHCLLESGQTTSGVTNVALTYAVCLQLRFKVNSEKFYLFCRLIFKKNSVTLYTYIILHT